MGFDLGIIASIVVILPREENRIFEKQTIIDLKGIFKVCIVLKGQIKCSGVYRKSNIIIYR